jgi:ADP-heptose:LPS heptosyltransferase
VIRLGALGDVVRTLPAVSSLRAGYPRAHIAWLVEPASAGALEGQPWLDETIVFPRPALRAALAGLRVGEALGRLRDLRRRLREPGFDLVLDFHSILKSGVLAALSGAPRRVAYARPYGRELGWTFANLRARLEPAHASRFERNEGMLRFLGVQAPPARAPFALCRRAEARMRDALGDAAPLAIHPGTSDATPHKRWTAEGYAAVARRLAEGEGIPSVVTAGPAGDDRAFAEAVVADSGGAARLAPPTPSLADLAALFARCRLYLGSDSGPMHVASLVGTPVLQLLGPTDPVENAPWSGTPWRHVRVQVGCNPCRRGCAARTCMRVIRPEAVVEAARALLAAPRPR